MKLKNKNILITGASSGIGKASAFRCAEDGAHIILSARNQEKLQVVKKEVEKIGGTAEIVPADVTKIEDIKNLFLKATAGGRVLDAVLSNAGLGHIAEIYELTTQQITQMIDVNITGMIMVSKMASEVMVRQKYGHILMTSSLAGLITLPGWSVYVATKWATTGFADSIRMELEKYNINITTIHPGAVKTEFFSKNKADIDIEKTGDAIDPLDVADAIYEAMFTGKKKVIIPSMAKSISFLYRFLPGLAQAQLQKMTQDVEYHQNIPEDMPEFSYIKPVKENLT
jgi:uncharacterized protein